jgi:hypothetical protein
MKCDLCILEIKTNVYYETEWYTILDCKDCNIPMAVWKYHRMKIPEQGAFVMEEMLKIHAEKFYGHSDFHIDKEQKKIPNHLHWHARLDK